MNRKITQQVNIGGCVIGGGAPVAIQSMTNTPTSDVEATVSQILRLEEAGCDIVRSSVPDMDSAAAFSEIKKRIHIPLVADIHFDYRLAVAVIENGADKIRINPGNIGSREKVLEVVKAAKERNIPIRVGVNSGSLEKRLLEKYGGPTAKALCESALDNVHIIEDMDYDNLVISIKSTDVNACIEAYDLVSAKTDHPLHIGITEAGTAYTGSIRSACGLSVMLYKGIGDTMRVSLTSDPVDEIITAKMILKTFGLRKGGIEVFSCPTCARTKIDIISLANEAEKVAADYPLDIKLAVMGCAVNGPGEAKEADLGIAGGNGEGLIFKNGQILRKVPENLLMEELKKELDNWE